MHKCARICKKRSALTCLLSGLFQPHTYTHTHTREPAHCTPAPSNPPPCSKQPPSGLVRANPALDSVAPIAAPPLLRVVREMKALGVHYKTTTAAAGDRPPGATSFAFPSFHLQLFLFFMSLNTVTPSVFSSPVLHTHAVPVILVIPEQTKTYKKKYSVQVK